MRALIWILGLCVSTSGCSVSTEAPAQMGDAVVSTQSDAAGRSVASPGTQAPRANAGAAGRDVAPQNMGIGAVGNGGSGTLTAGRAGSPAGATAVAAGSSGTAANNSAGAASNAAGAAGDSSAAAGSAGAPIGGTGASTAAAGASATDKAKLTPLTVWIAGDSTVMTYTPDRAPLEGWGQELPMFLDAKASINNQALGGRSTRTFVYNNVICVNGKAAFEGGTPNKSGARWEIIEKGIKPGDFCLMQFGHNDEAKDYCERYVELPEFKQNLTQMIQAIRDRSATPILVTPMSRLNYKNGVFTATLTDYSKAMKEVAAAESIELVDLNSMSVKYYESVGYDKLTKDIFEPGGNTHFQKQGAIEMARLVSQGLAADGGGLSAYVKK